MRKSLKAIAIAAAAGALAIGSAFTASAASLYNGQWCDEGAEGWWYKLNADGSTFLANTWYWIKDTDGVIRCYYFDHDGWLQTNKTIDGNTVDANGRWVVNGVVQTANENDKDFATSVVFETEKQSTSSSSSTGSTTAVVSSGNKNAYKSSGAGDNPGAATFTTEYSKSVVNGTTATNEWANYSITLPGIPSIDSSDGGTDWTYTSDPAQIACYYVKLDKYAAGNTDINKFIQSFIADKRGFYKGQVVGAVTLGNIPFTQLRAETPDPTGTKYDYAYVRVIDGTGFVQVIECDTNGGTDFASALQTMKTIR
jgi:hypothetical protein